MRRLQQVASLLIWATTVLACINSGKSFSYSATLGRAKNRRPIGPRFGGGFVNRHVSLRSPAVASSPKLSRVEQDDGTLDWSFLDAAYIITCPNADCDGERLSQTQTVVNELGLPNSVELTVKEFRTDDEDRVRGCYNSHISVLRDAMQSRRRQEKSCLILVLEDNLATGGARLTQSIIDDWADFARENEDRCDMVHLAYTPYVPNLTLEATDNPRLKRLRCGIGSALGTSAYIINTSGMTAILKEDSRNGYVESIPEVMARLFPETRYAAFPTPFQRAPTTKSLVNPQLDDLRAILFQPPVVSKAQALLTLSGLSTNTLLPLVSLALIGTAGVAGTITMDAAQELLTTGSYEGNVVMPLLSSAFSLFSLGILALGAALAPKPEPSPSPVVAEENLL